MNQDQTTDQTPVQESPAPGLDGKFTHMLPFRTKDGRHARLLGFVDMAPNPMIVAVEVNPDMRSDAGHSEFMVAYPLDGKVPNHNLCLVNLHGDYEHEFANLRGALVDMAFDNGMCHQGGPTIDQLVAHWFSVLTSQVSPHWLSTANLIIGCMTGEERDEFVCGDTDEFCRRYLALHPQRTQMLEIAHAVLDIAFNTPLPTAPVPGTEAAST